MADRPECFRLAEALTLEHLGNDEWRERQDAVLALDSR